MPFILKIKDNNSWQEGRENGIIYTVDGNMNYHSPYEQQSGRSKKTKKENLLSQNYLVNEDVFF